MQGAAIRAGTELGGAPMPPAGGIAIDDLDAAIDEEALLHLLNLAQENGVPVLMAAREPPARWRLALADLASRVRGTTAVRILPPEDELLRALLARLLSARQIAVAEAVQEWLFRRLPRTPAAIRAAAVALDARAMADGTAVTRAVAERVLARLCEDEAVELPQ
jgi:chromosomal replication initiation ATPase DnaA